METDENRGTSFNIFSSDIDARKDEATILEKRFEIFVIKLIDEENED